MNEEKKFKNPTSPFWESIKAQYPNHWVLIGNPVIPRGEYAIQSGELLYASEKKDDVSAEIRRRGNFSRGVFFTGKRKHRAYLL